MPRSPPTPAWKVALWTSPIFAVLAVGLGGLRTGYTLRSVLLWGIAGLAMGAMFVPEIEPRSVRTPALWQMSCGALGGVVMALVLHATPLGIACGAMVGAMLGFVAPFWPKWLDF